MSRKTTWEMAGLRVGMWWPRTTLVTIWAHLSDGRGLQASLTLDEARELRDSLSNWLDSAERDHAQRTEAPHA